METRIDADEIENTISRVEALSDEKLQSLVDVISDENLRAELLESLKWRRDNVRKVFLTSHI